MTLQLAIILGISAYFFAGQILPNLHVIAAILIVATTLFVFVGMVIGYLFRVEQTITLITVAVSSKLLLLSDLILPIESMPGYFQNIVKFNPFLIAERMLKRSILFGAGFGDLVSGFIILGIYIAAMFFIIMLIENLIKRHTWERLFRALFPFKKK